MIIGNYRALREIGRGGHGVVYEAEHIALGRRVAIKVLYERLARRADSVRRFLLEARAVSQFRHPNIVEVTDFGQTDDGRVYFVMELLEGDILADALGRERVFPLVRTLRHPADCARLEGRTWPWHRAPRS